MRLRASRRRLLTASLVGCGLALLSACGGDQRSVLSQAADNLGHVRSGNMDLRMAVMGSGGNSAGQIGFEERGPFALPSPGALPVARTEVIHFVGNQQQSTTFIATGKNAYIGSGGSTYSLPAARVDALRRASQATGSTAGLDSLHIDRWAVGTSVTGDAQADGVSSDRVTGSVDVRRFLNDLMQLSRSLGETASVPQVGDADAQNLARAVKATHFEALIGHDDHLLRKLTVSVDFAAPTGADTSGALARYARTRLELDLALAAVNQPVSVGEPANAQPFSAFCARTSDAAACNGAQS